MGDGQNATVKLSETQIIPIYLCASLRAWPRGPRASGSPHDASLASVLRVDSAGGFGVFLGLTTLTATLAKVEGIGLGWVSYARAAVLTAGSVWSIWLAWQQLAGAASTFRRIGGLLAFAVAVGVVAFAWGMLLFGWGAMR